MGVREDRTARTLGRASEDEGTTAHFSEKLAEGARRFRPALGVLRGGPRPPSIWTPDGRGSYRV